MLALLPKCMALQMFEKTKLNAFYLKTTQLLLKEIYMQLRHLMC